MGEYPEEYENGEFVVAPTWVHGFQDARAGIAMQVEPQLNTPSYSEGGDLRWTGQTAGK